MSGNFGSIRESDIEKYLTKQVKLLGGKAYKWVSPGNNGVPDRIVFLPKGHIIFVELKAPGKMPTELQTHQHRKLNALGHDVFVLDGMAKVDDFIGSCKALIGGDA